VDISGSSQDPSGATKISGMSRAPGSQGGFVKTFLAKKDGNHAKNKYVEKK